MAKRKVKSPPVFHCSFCGKSQHQVKNLITAGPKADICNECIAICNEIIEEHRLKELVWKTIVALNKQQGAASTSEGAAK